MAMGGGEVGKGGLGFSARKPEGHGRATSGQELEVWRRGKVRSEYNMSNKGRREVIWAGRMKVYASAGNKRQMHVCIVIYKR